MAAVNKRSLTLSVGGTDYTGQVSDVHIEAAEGDSDFVTFAEAAAGGAREYRLVFTATQDMVASTLWDRVWSSPGTTVAYLIKPYGNTTASATQPHFSGNAVIAEPDGTLIGGEADAAANARMTFECSWVCTAKPTKVTS